MKTDPALLKAILQYAEDNADGGETDHIPTADNFTQFSELTDKLLHHHIKLCEEAGFLEIQMTDRTADNCVIPLYPPGRDHSSLLTLPQLPS
ncbi:MAG: hypothetical protein OXO50_13965 [Caldilineaceae bacterium]|nr:hypothetical protein [Caldilineaceae bacterium]